LLATSLLLVSCYDISQAGPTDTADDSFVDSLRVYPGPADPLITEPVDRCSALVDDLREELEESQACTAVMMVDYITHEYEGFEINCGDRIEVRDEDARWSAYAVTGGWGGPDDLDLVNSADVDGLYIYVDYPCDVGGMAVVSTSTGLVVFGGSIGWMGTGHVRVPESWRDPDESGQDCSSGGGIPAYRVTEPFEVEELLSERDGMHALDIADRTALMTAMRDHGEITNAVVLRYPRSVGEFSPPEADWIVMVNWIR